MIELTTDKWQEEFHHNEYKILFVHTPFCATCQLAERMLGVVEETENNVPLYRMNASFFPDFMEKNKIKSVPALLLVYNDTVTDDLYAFESVPKIYQYVQSWKKKLRIDDDLGENTNNFSYL
ncbi:thioredoxin family protein [Gracilibacillus sp. YIM 98692]|uniref:thioredoxin family protein n=1 Tax=Gracilibacillus sp. YIM 98692 TaxID=2663532 RepID=UPI0013D31AC3|nr:thioredoxin family protein [Gracilibacillus sp. YIM 98692]